MLGHEMHFKAIANDRYSGWLLEAESNRLAKANQRSSSMVQALGRLLIHVVNMLASVI